MKTEEPWYSKLIALGIAALTVTACGWGWVFYMLNK